MSEASLRIAEMPPGAADAVLNALPLPVITTFMSVSQPESSA